MSEIPVVPPSAFPRLPPATGWRAIAAVARNRVIGREGRIPWHLPEDFRWFKHCTLGQVVVMGRKTYQSLGRPLPGRTNVVVSRTWSPPPEVRVVRSLEEIAELFPPAQVWIIGGEEIYRAALPGCPELILTLVSLAPEGDTFFPPFEDEYPEHETLWTGPGFSVERRSRGSASPPPDLAHRPLISP